MARSKARADLTEAGWHQLWVLAFRTRQEAFNELEEHKTIAARNSLTLLGAILDELRSRGVQGTLEDPERRRGQGASSR